jgi:hypothetical protein
LSIVINSRFAKKLNLYKNHASKRDLTFFVSWLLPPLNIGLRVIENRKQIKLKNDFYLTSDKPTIVAIVRASFNHMINRMHAQILVRNIYNT